MTNRCRPKTWPYMIEKHCYEIREVELCHSPAKALEIIRKDHFDLLFLDIEMPEMNGFDFIELAKLSKKTKIIITSAYEQYAIPAFDADAVHYLLKPVKEDKLVKAVRKVCQELQLHHPVSNSLSQQVISVYDHHEHHIVKLDEIIRLEADGNYTKIVTKEQLFLSSKKMGHYQQELPEDHFFRTHKSHMVNLSFVNKIFKGKAGFIGLSNGEKVPLSASNKEAFERALGLN